MNLTLRVIILTYFVISIFSPLSGQTICFERKNAIWLSDINGHNQKLFIKAAEVKSLQAMDFKISPDGRNLSCTSSLEQVGKTKRYRGILLFDIQTKQKTLLDAVPELNNYEATWSPNSKRIAFVYPYSNPTGGVSTGIGIIDKSNSNYKLLTEFLGPRDYSADNYAWFSNSNSIIILSIHSLYSVNDQGKFYKVEDFVLNPKKDPEYILSSATRFRLSKDSSQILFDPEIYDDGSINFKGYWFESIYGAICIYDRPSKITRRLTPKNISAQYPEWFPNGNAILFEGVEGIGEKGSKRILSSLYKIDIKTREYVVIIKDATNPSISLK
jgi:Tol biopolymer transport system component